MSPVLIVLVLIALAAELASLYCSRVRSTKERRSG